MVTVTIPMLAAYTLGVLIMGSGGLALVLDHLKYGMFRKPSVLWALLGLCVAALGMADAVLFPI